MQLRSIGWRTHLFLARIRGFVETHPSHLVLRTPTNPGYYWGNFVIFDGPPSTGDLDHWLECFARGITDHQPARHTLFGVDVTDGPQGDLEPFIERGFEVEDNAVLVTDTLSAPEHLAGDLVVRPLQSDAEWADAIANQVLCRSEVFSLEAYTPFKTAQMGDYRRMAAAGHGAWFGAFAGDELVGELGVFVDEDGIARYQSVGTHPEWRRRGVARTMVYEAGRIAAERFGAETFVIEVEPDSAPMRVYESAGFVQVETTFALVRS